MQKKKSLKTLSWQLDMLAMIMGKEEVAFNKFGNFNYQLIGSQQDALDYIFGANKRSWTVKQTYQELDHMIVVGDLTVEFVDRSIVTRSGAGAHQVTKSSKTGKFLDGGIERDFPNAESRAFKNACKKLGNRLGRSLMRDPDLTDKEPQKVSASLAKLMDSKKEEQEFELATSEEQRKKIIDKIGRATAEQLELISGDLRLEYGVYIEARLQALEGGAQ